MTYKNKKIKYRKDKPKPTPDQLKKFAIPEEYGKIILDYIERGLTTLSIERRDIVINEKTGKKKEHYIIKPVNEDGWI
jgi:hypothetical protein